MVPCLHDWNQSSACICFNFGNLSWRPGGWLLLGASILLDRTLQIAAFVPTVHSDPALWRARLFYTSHQRPNRNMGSWNFCIVDASTCLRANGYCRSGFSFALPLG